MRGSARTLSLFLFSRVSSIFGMQLIVYNFLFRAVAQGRGPYGLSQLGLVATLATAIGAFPLGHLIDHVRPKVSLLTSHTLLLVFAIVLSVVNPQSWAVILISTALLATLRNYRSISQSAVLGDLLPKEPAKAAHWINISTLAWQAAALLAPLLAGVLGSSSLTLVIAAIVLSFSFFAQLQIARKLPAHERVQNQKGIQGSARDVLQEFRKNFKLRSSLLLDFFVVFFAGVSALLPFLHEGYDQPLIIGLLRAAMPLGVIIATLARLYTPQKGSWAVVLFAATLIFGLAHLALLMTTTLLAAFALLALAGFCDGLSLSVRETLLQTETPRALRARIFALNSFLVNASEELSEWESGFVGSKIGVRATIAFGGLASVAVSAVFAAKAETFIFVKIKTGVQDANAALRN